MGYAYLGLGLGGAVAPPAINWMIRGLGWRSAIEATGAAALLVLIPVGLWVTRSAPGEMGLHPDGVDSSTITRLEISVAPAVIEISEAAKDKNFWLILVGSALVIGAMNAVIQHFIFFLESVGNSPSQATRTLSILLIASLASRVIVGYLADRFNKKNTMACFYLLLCAAILILPFAGHPAMALGFAVVFGFAMGADYMLIPLVTAECFGVAALGKILSLIIMGYSIGQWMAPWCAGKIFDTYHSYDNAWKLMACLGLIGAFMIFAISSRPKWKAGGVFPKTSCNTQP
jgi:sugar phosphate permease